MSRFVLSFFTVLFLLPFSAQAQTAENPDVVSDPLCFTVINKAPYKVYGTIGTNYYVDPATGVKARHRSNFRLEEPGTKDPEKGYPLDQAEFCSYGPFYPDRKLELVLRTLVPIFSCMTKIDQGPIVITGAFKPEGGTDTRASCFE